MMKLVKRFIFLICLFFIFGSLVDAKQVDVHLFWGEGCPHCAHEKDFLKDINKKYDDVSINLYEVWNNESNALLLDDVKSSFGSENSSSVPYTVVGNRSFSGYNANIGLQIENAIKDCSKMKCSNVVGDISKNGKFTVDVDKSMNDKVVIPIIGEVNAKNVSLPIVAVVIGFVDGFNPCAMWILLFLISVLIGIPSKKKRWLIGLTFLLTSAFVYFLFMVAWLNITLQIKDVVVLRIIIAFVALIGGFINLRSYFKSTSSGCDVTSVRKRRVIFDRIRSFTGQKNLFLALGGVMILAFTVNLIELACSAGLPLLFTQVLAFNDLSNFQYMFYMFIYILFFLLDDVVIFVMAMITMEVTGISTKYNKLSHLIGGILMLLIGLLLVFKPEWIMFNF